MERSEFREAVFERDGGKCVVCGQPGQDAHHLMERRLWDDGGYHLDNGVTLCGECHKLAEATTLDPASLRQWAGIEKVLLPDHLYPDEEYDKWGNMYLPGGGRIPGELFYDESVQKVLEPALGHFVRHFKYPRTYHLPWSPGATKDDRVMKETPWKGKEVVVTEKLDGENTTMYRDYIHARSLDMSYHQSRTWVKNLHGKIAHEIPEGWRFCGENLAAKHSISYRDLPSYFMLFSVWNEKNECLPWDETVEWAELLGVPTVPVLWRGTKGKSPIWTNDEEMRACLAPFIALGGKYGDEMEGYVVRTRSGFPYRDFRKRVGKYVRAGHVDETRHNWKHEMMVPNLLSS
jgi:hypothetical protein